MNIGSEVRCSLQFSTLLHRTMAYGSLSGVICITTGTFGGRTLRSVVRSIVRNSFINVLEQLEPSFFLGSMPRFGKGNSEIFRSASGSLRKRCRAPGQDGTFISRWHR